MIKSMTGFGRSEIEKDGIKITVEIKSVNHRYCDIGIKLPKKLNSLESYVRGIIKEYASRGKIDVFVSYEEFEEKQVQIEYNKQVAKAYYEGLLQITEDFQLQSKELSPVVLARFPEVFTSKDQELDVEGIKQILGDAVRTALENFVASRVSEGESLYTDITKKLQDIENYVCEVEKRSPEILKEYREKLLTKVREFLEDKDIDEAVLATELTIYADKICVDEETVRLHSHIENMRNTLLLEEAIGRKLDFIAQEMNREANTTLSKANDMKLSNIAIDLKTEIEKVREQIQNIE